MVKILQFSIYLVILGKDGTKLLEIKDIEEFFIKLTELINTMNRNMKEKMPNKTILMKLSDFSTFLNGKILNQYIKNEIIFRF